MGGPAGRHPHHPGDRCPDLPGPFFLPPSRREQRRVWVRQLLWHHFLWNTLLFILRSWNSQAQLHTDRYTHHESWLCHLHSCRRTAKDYNCIGRLTSLPLTLLALADTLTPTCMYTHFLIGEPGHTLVVTCHKRSSDSYCTGTFCIHVCVCAYTLWMC